MRIISLKTVVGRDGICMATLRSNIIANHLWADNENNPSLNNKHFLADGVFTAQAIKIENYWRIRELKITLFGALVME